MFQDLYFQSHNLVLHTYSGMQAYKYVYSRYKNMQCTLIRKTKAENPF